MKKEYSEFTEVQKHWLHEYKSWCKCGRENPELIAYVLTQVELYGGFLSKAGIDPSDY